MSFNPIENLTTVIREVSKDTDPVVLDNVITYLLSIDHKLTCVELFYNKLNATFKEVNIKDDIEIDQNRKNINIYTDCFIYSVSGLFDVLTKFIYVVFNIELPSKAYFNNSTLKDMLDKIDKDEIFAVFRIPDWFNELIQYRNAFAHNIVPCSKVHKIENTLSMFEETLGLHANLETERYLFYLPDAPRETLNKRTTKKAIQIKPYCERIYRSTNRLLNLCLSHIIDRLANCHTLPLERNGTDHF